MRPYSRMSFELTRSTSVRAFTRVPLPLAFLQGCGSPMPKNQDFADRLYADLQASGVRCWFAPKDIPIGARVREAIDDGIRDKDRLLLIWSEDSVSSSWVEKDRILPAMAALRRTRGDESTIFGTSEVWV